MSTTTPVDIGSLITSTPGVQGGMECIVGTRVPVRGIALLYGEGASVEQMEEEFPGIPTSHFHAAIAYYLVNRERIDADIHAEIDLYERSRAEARQERDRKIPSWSRVLRFYLDEDIRGALLRALRQQGADVLSTPEAGRRSRSDRDQLAYAMQFGRVIVTRNARDYAVLHRETIEAGETHAGIVMISRQRFAPGEYAAALERLSRQSTPDAMANRLVWL
jgi:uncharacterized protein (DUF433 family)